MLIISLTKKRCKRKIYGYVNGPTSGIHLKQPWPMGYHRIGMELLCSSVVAKTKEYAMSGIVRQLNIDNFTAACNHRHKERDWKRMYVM